MESSEHAPKVEMVHDYPKQVYPDPPYKPPEYLEYLEQATNAIHSVRIIVYAGMAAFVLVATYVFVLIYFLTSDARIMSEQMLRMSAQMEQMSRNIGAINSTIADMSGNVADMRATMARMDGSITRMDLSMAHMDATVTLIQHSARNLDSSIGPTMGVMNRFMPFGASGNSYPGAPPFAPMR